MAQMPGTTTVRTTGAGGQQPQRGRTGQSPGKGKQQRIQHPSQRLEWLRQGSTFLLYCDANRDVCVVASSHTAIAAAQMKRNLRAHAKWREAQQISRLIHLAGQRQFEAARLWIAVAARYRGTIGEPGTPKAQTKKFDPTK